MTDSSNSLSFNEAINQLPSYIREPHSNKIADIEPRRLAIYRDLFYNNIERFVASAFPVMRKLIANEQWHHLIRQFMVDYRCSTPYFLEISQEFIHFIQQLPEEQWLFPFMQELAHYEWVEIALDVDDTDITKMPYQSSKSLLDRLPVVSPLAWPLVYQYPVHQISVNHQPSEPPEQPTLLIVYRNRQDQVKFMESNAITLRLLEILAEPDMLSARQAIRQLGEEIQHPDPQQLQASGLQILGKLQQLDIILGS